MARSTKTTKARSTRTAAVTTVRARRPVNAKLNVAAVRRIRELSEQKKASVTELARKYNVHHSTIQAVIARETWRTV